MKEPSDRICQLYLVQKCEGRSRISVRRKKKIMILYIPIQKAFSFAQSCNVVIRDGEERSPISSNVTWADAILSLTPQFPGA